MKWINASIKSFVNGQITMDPKAWSGANGWLLEPMYADLWLKKILLVKDKIKEKNIEMEKVANTFIGPSMLRKEFRWALWNMKLLGWSKEKRMEVLDFYREILEFKAGDDTFGNNTTHWHNKDEVDSIVKITNWIKADKEYKKQVGKISANCPALTWSLYTDFYYNFAYEMHGLYELKDNEVLMIRNYGPFKAKDLWNESKNFPINKITIKCVYEGLKGKFDFINHFVTDDNIMEKLKYFSIEVDGKEITDKEELDRINNLIIEMVIGQDKEMNKLDFEGLKKISVLSKHFAFKNLFDLVNVGWYPEKEVFERFENKELLSIDFSNLEDVKSFWEEVFCPIEDFSREELKQAAKELKKL